MAPGNIKSWMIMSLDVHYWDNYTNHNNLDLPCRDLTLRSANRDLKDWRELLKESNISVAN